MSVATDRILPMPRETRAEMRERIAGMHRGFDGIESGRREIEGIFAARSIVGGAVSDELERRRAASERKEIMVEGPSA